MAFTPKNWQDLPSTTTPLSAAALEDLEARVTAYADSVAVPGSDPNAVVKTMFDAKGDMLAATANDTPTRVGIPTPFGADGAQLVTDSSQTSGVRWSPKAADYNIMEAGATPGFSDVGTATSNSAAINAAFTSAASAGRPCLIPPGIFYFNDQIVIPPKLHARGFGEGISVLRVQAATTLSYEPIRNNGSLDNPNITLENFEIDGNRVARGQNTFGGAPGYGTLNLRGTYNQQMTNLRLLGMSVHGSAGVGIGLFNQYGALIQGCHIYDHIRDGCSFLGSGQGFASWHQRCRFVDNTVHDVGDDFVGMGGDDVQGNQTHNMVVANNNFYNSFAAGMAVNCHGVRDVAIVGNVMSFQYSNTLQVCNHGSVGSEGVTIAGNVMREPGFQQPSVTAAGGWFGELGPRTDGPYAGEGGPLGSVSHINWVGNTMMYPMSHGLFLRSRTGATLQHLRVAQNLILSSAGSGRADTSCGIFVDAGSPASSIRHITVDGNQFQDFKGKAWHGNSETVDYVRFVNNYVLSCNKGSAFNGTPPVDFTNHTNVDYNNNRVLDLASPKRHSQVAAFGGTTNGRMMGNNFTGGASAAGIAGSPGAGFIQSDNVDLNGTLREGTAATAGNV